MNGLLWHMVLFGGNLLTSGRLQLSRVKGSGLRMVPEKTDLAFMPENENNKDSF